MKKLKKCFACLCAVTCIAGSLHVQAKTTEEKISQAQQELQDQKNKIEESKEQLENLEDSKAQLEGSLADLNDQFTTLSSELTGLEEKLTIKQYEINQTQTQLESAEKVEQQQYESMKKRIKYLYELGGDTTIFQMLLDEKSFADMLNRADYYSKITEYDRDMLNEYQDTRTEIQSTKTLLEQEQKDLQTLIADREDKQSEVEELVMKTSQDIAQQTTDIEAAEQAALQYEQQLEEKMSEVGTLQAQLAYEKAIKEAEEKGLSGTEGFSLSSQEVETALAGYTDASLAGNLAVMSAIIFCEAGGEPYQGKLAVGSVIMNRIRSGYFPDNLLGVLYQKSQFTPVMSGRFAIVLAKGLANPDSIQAAQEVLNGVNVVPDCLFFRTVIDGIQGQIIGAQIFY